MSDMAGEASSRNVSMLEKIAAAIDQKMQNVTVEDGLRAVISSVPQDLVVCGRELGANNASKHTHLAGSSSGERELQLHKCSVMGTSALSQPASHKYRHTQLLSVESQP